MKNFKFIFSIFGMTCLTHFCVNQVSADISDQTKAVYYDTKVKAKDAYDQAADKVNDTFDSASDRTKAAYYETKVKARDAKDEASDRTKAAYYNTKVKAEDSFKD